MDDIRDHIVQEDLGIISFYLLLVFYEILGKLTFLA